MWGESGDVRYHILYCKRPRNALALLEMSNVRLRDQEHYAMSTCLMLSEHMCNGLTRHLSRVTAGLETN